MKLKQTNGFRHVTVWYCVTLMTSLLPVEEEYNLIIYSNIVFYVIKWSEYVLHHWCRVTNSCNDTAEAKKLLFVVESKSLKFKYSTAVLTRSLFIWSWHLVWIPIAFCLQPNAEHQLYAILRFFFWIKFQRNYAAANRTLRSVFFLGMCLPLNI